ncbi:UNVERIFIED_CONTAM: hypothetical protein HDU68_002311, partial [Siphonaria sp. JEL0065]
MAETESESTSSALFLAPRAHDSLDYLGGLGDGSLGCSTSSLLDSKDSRDSKTPSPRLLKKVRATDIIRRMASKDSVDASPNGSGDNLVLNPDLAEESNPGIVKPQKEKEADPGSSSSINMNTQYLTTADKSRKKMSAKELLAKQNNNTINNNSLQISPRPYKEASTGLSPTVSIRSSLSRSSDREELLEMKTLATQMQMQIEALAEQNRQLFEALQIANSRNVKLEGPVVPEPYIPQSQSPVLSRPFPFPINDDSLYSFHSSNSVANGSSSSLDSTGGGGLASNSKRPQPKLVPLLDDKERNSEVAEKYQQRRSVDNSALVPTPTQTDQLSQLQREFLKGPRNSETHPEDSSSTNDSTTKRPKGILKSRTASVSSSICLSVESFDDTPPSPSLMGDRLSVSGIGNGNGTEKKKLKWYKSIISDVK